MSNLVEYILTLHVIAGGIALASGLFSIIFKSKIKYHRLSGKIYFYSMTFVFISACVVSVYKKNVFLFCVAVFTYYACLTALRSLKLKKLHLQQTPKWYDWLIEVIFGTINLTFFLFGFFNFNTDPSISIVSITFGFFGLQGNYSTIRRLKNKNLKYKSYWLLSHISGMLGSYIGAVTAFIVNNGNNWPIHPLFLWLGPTIALVPFIIYERRKQIKLSGEL